MELSEAILAADSCFLRDQILTDVMRAYAYEIFTCCIIQVHAPI